jgi:hypothetical protein
MSWDYVSEPWQTADVLFTAQVIPEHEEPWWNNIDREIRLIRPPEVSSDSTSSHLVAGRRNRRKKWILPCEVSLSNFEGVFNMP